MATTLDAFGNPVFAGPDQYGVVAISNLAALKQVRIAPVQGTVVNTLGKYVERDGLGAAYEWVSYDQTTPDDDMVVKCDEILFGRFRKIPQPGGGGDVSTVFSVANYGAVGDFVETTDAVLVNGSNVVTSATAGFVGSDIGKRLVAAVVNVNGPVYGIVTTGVSPNQAISGIDGVITGVTSPTSCTVSNPSTVSASGCWMNKGTVNNTPFLTCIAAVSAAGGGVLYIPTGKYMLDRSPASDGNSLILQIPSKTTVLGAGRDRSILVLTGNAGQSSRMLSCYGTSDVIIDSVGFDGNGWFQCNVFNGQYAEQQHATFLINNADRCTVKNCWHRRCRGDGIYLRPLTQPARPHSTLITGCYFSDNIRDDIHAQGCIDCVIDSNIFKNNFGQLHIKTEPDNPGDCKVDGLIVSNNTFSEDVFNGNIGGVLIQGFEANEFRSKNIIVTNNVFKNMGFGVLIGGSSDGWVVSNNTFDKTTVGISSVTANDAKAYGINNRDVTITGNVITNTVKNDDGFAISLAGMENLTVTGNTMSGADLRNGLAIQTSVNVVVSGNVIKAPGDNVGISPGHTEHTGIFLYGPRRCVVENNIIEMHEAGYADGINLYDASGAYDLSTQDLVIGHNILRGEFKYGYILVGLVANTARINYAAPDYGSSTFSIAQVSDQRVAGVATELAYGYKPLVIDQSAPNGAKFTVYPWSPTADASNGLVARSWSAGSMRWNNGAKTVTNGSVLLGQALTAPGTPGTWVDMWVPTSSSSLSSIDDTSTAALIHANSVCGFTNPSRSLLVDMREPPGATNVGFKSISQVNSGANIRVFSGADSGSRQFTTGATAVSWSQLYSLADGCYVEPTFADIINQRWHFECDIKLSTTPDANTSLLFGLSDTSLTPSIGVGVRGAQSTTKYRCFIWGTSTGVNSTVTIDANWHRLRMWCAGGTLVYFQVDNETPVSFSPGTAGVVGPFFDIRNGATAAAQTVRTRYAIYRWDG